MDKEEYEVDYHKAENVSRSDLFLAEHYEELFYLNPKELAMAINAMNEDELLQFNLTIWDGYGMNVDLMMDKLDDLNKYQNVNMTIFTQAYLRTTLIDKVLFHEWFSEIKKMFGDNGKCPKAIDSYGILFNIYPAFREHFFKLKKAGIIEVTKTGLKWNRDKISIAEYFDCLECKERNRRWKYVEDIFGYDKLCQYLNVHREQQRKPSKAFEEIKSLLEIK